MNRICLVILVLCSISASAGEKQENVSVRLRKMLAKSKQIDRNMTQITRRANVADAKKQSPPQKIQIKEVMVKRDPPKETSKKRERAIKPTNIYSKSSGYGGSSCSSTSSCGSTVTYTEAPRRSSNVNINFMVYPRRRYWNNRWQYWHPRRGTWVFISSDMVWNDGYGGWVGVGIIGGRGYRRRYRNDKYHHDHRKNYWDSPKYAPGSWNDRHWRSWQKSKKRRNGDKPEHHHKKKKRRNKK